MMLSNEERDALLKCHMDAVNALADAKALEAKLRMEVLTKLFNYDDNILRSGTDNLDLGNKWVCKAEFKTTYKLNDEDNSVGKMLDKLDSLGEEGKFLADRLVKFKPELSIAEYKTLPPKYKAIVDTIVIASNSLPSVKIVQSKK